MPIVKGTVTIDSLKVALKPTKKSKPQSPSSEAKSVAGSTVLSVPHERLHSLSDQPTSILEAKEKVHTRPPDIRKPSVLKQPSRTHDFTTPVSTDVKQQATTAAETVTSINEKLAANDARLLKIGCTTVDSRGCPALEHEVLALLRLMRNERQRLSAKRVKLLVANRTFTHYDQINRELDKTMQDISMERNQELRAEVNRIGDELEERSKTIRKKHGTLETDVVKATNVREKWFDVQNKFLMAVDEESETKRDVNYHRAYHCTLLEQKKELRKEQAELRQQAKIIPLLPWYGALDDEIRLVKSYIDKFK